MGYVMLFYIQILTMKIGGPLNKNISCYLLCENGEKIPVFKKAETVKDKRLSAEEAIDLLKEISKSPFASLSPNRSDESRTKVKEPVLKTRDDFGQIRNLKFNKLNLISDDFIELERRVPVAGGFETISEKYLYLAEETLAKRTALYEFDLDLFLIADGKSFVKVKEVNGAAFDFPKFEQNLKIKNGACDLIIKDRNFDKSKEYKGLAYKAVRDHDRDLKFIEIIGDSSDTKYIPASDLKDPDYLANLSDFLESIDLRQEVLIDNGKAASSFFAVKLRDPKTHKDLSETGSIFLKPVTALDTPPRKTKPTDRLKRKITTIKDGDGTALKMHFQGPEKS